MSATLDSSPATIWKGAVLTGADIPTKQLSLLSPLERRQLLIEWKATEADYTKEERVHELYKQQVEKSPEAVALVYEENSLSYGKLNARANRLIAHLREMDV